MRRNRGQTSFLRWVSIGSFLIAAILLTIQLITFSRSRITYPPAMVIAGVPVGNLERDQAAERLLEVYSLPVDLRYNDAVIQLDPAVIGFRINLENMLAAADLERVGGSFWNQFWNFLWSNQFDPEPVPLDASFSESLLRTYLTEEIGSRYDQPPIPSRPQIGTTNFQPGTPGTTINLDLAVAQIERALFSSSRRTVQLSIERAEPGRPSFSNLEILLKQILDVAEFDGIAGVYLFDLQTSQEIHFLYQNKVDLLTIPDLAFTASSVIKIPIMISVFQQYDQPLPTEVETLLIQMIAESSNDAADLLMEAYIEPGRGPLAVTEDIRALGYENTYIAGHFYKGAPLLAQFTTPANTRTDASTDPDPYNQTTLTDIGMFMTDIYQCAEYGGGALIAIFQDDITQQECRQMIEILDQEKFFPWLFEAGVPAGTKVAHKHGFYSDPNTNVVYTIGDAGIFYTPSGDYVLVIFFAHPVQLIWEPNANLFADLTQAVYNYYNVSSD